MLGAGDCFLIETNRDEDGYVKSHLHVVILDCEKYTGTTIIVVIETLEGKKDETVVLKEGDHEFIHRDSYVNYSRARTTSNTDIQKLLDGGKAKPMKPVTNEILKRIQKGIVDSPFTPKYVLDYYQHKANDQAFGGVR